MSVVPNSVPATGHESAPVAPRPRVTPERLRCLLDALSVGLVERETPVRLALLATLAGEHLLLIGPPGTAKSEIARRLRHAFAGATFFERLLTRFSVPEELFGPLSIRELEQDRYVRRIEGYLPAASVAFIDEVFKANSAILNSLLSLLNERLFDNGTERVEVPLLCVVAASNELPEGDELSALYDRFLLRYRVDPTSDAGFRDLVRMPDEPMPPPDAELLLMPEDVAEVQARAKRVAVPDDVLGLVEALRAHLRDRKVPVSDRRWRKAVKLLRVSAAANGRDTVSVWDAWLLQHCTWSRPEEREMVYEWYRDRVGTADASEPKRLNRLLDTFAARLEAEKRARVQAMDSMGRLLWEGADGRPTPEQGKRQKRNAEGEPLFLHPDTRQHDRTNGGSGYTRKQIRELGYGDHYCREEGLFFMELMPPCMQPARYSPAHVEGRVAETERLAAAIQAEIEAVARRRSEVESDLATHLFVAPGFTPEATRRLEEQARILAKLLARAQEVRDGFAALPRTEE